jgi:arylsulfatase A-like enzyme
MTTPAASSENGDPTADRSVVLADAGWSVFCWLLAFGALGGALAEIAVILGARFALGRITLFNPQGIWLSPLATAAILLLPTAIAWWVAGRGGRRDRAVLAATFIAISLAAFVPLLVLKGRLHIVALVALALGAGAQGARLARVRPESFLRALRLSTMALGAASMVGAIGFNAVRGWRERTTLANLPPSAAGEPNVLLLVLDTVRALSLSVYGHTRPTTPFLTELAARGVRFDRAIASSSWTLPSHATLFTGRFPHELSASWSDPLDDEYPTLAERLASRGYVTAGVVANLRYTSYEFGLNRGFAYYRDYDVSLSELWRASALSRELIMGIAKQVDGEPGLGRQWAPRINERFLRWIDKRPTDRPFFAFLNYYDAHGPYAPPAPYDTLFLGRRATVRDPSISPFTPTQLAEIETAYDASIAYLDAGLRELFAQLERRGALRNTLIIITSDHGEEFNEHGVMSHGSSLYLPSVHVPLLMVWPERLPAGRVVAAPVTLRDVPATVLDLSGGSTRHGTDALPGNSLAPHWTDTIAVPERSPRLSEVDFARNLPAGTPITLGDMKAVSLHGLRYIRRGDGKEELFDIATDPRESRPLLGTPSLDSLHQRLRAVLDSVRVAANRGSR